MDGLTASTENKETSPDPGPCQIQLKHRFCLACFFPEVPCRAFIGSHLVLGTVCLVPLGARG